MKLYYYINNADPDHTVSCNLTKHHVQLFYLSDGFCNLFYNYTYFEIAGSIHMICPLIIQPVCFECVAVRPIYFIAPQAFFYMKLNLDDLIATSNSHGPWILCGVSLNDGVYFVFTEVNNTKNTLWPYFRFDSSFSDWGSRGFNNRSLSSFPDLKRRLCLS